MSNQSILTKYLPATNHRGARIKAWTSGQASAPADIKHKFQLVMSYEHGCENKHMFVAMKLAKKLGWEGEYIEGHWGNKGNVYVKHTGDDRDSFKIC